MSVTRVRQGVLWNCFKLDCPVKGYSITQGELLPPKRKQSRLKPYRGSLLPADYGDSEYFINRFGLGTEFARDIQVTLDDRYSLPVKDLTGMIRGYVIRNGWTGCPPCPRLSDWQGPKTVLYMHAVGPSQAWYPDPHENRLVLVEDQMSALRCQQEGISAVALLGTGLDNDKVREIAMWKPSEVIIALDADATDEAFKLARKWGLAFKKTRVAVLEQDLKEEAYGDIGEVLGL